MARDGKVIRHVQLIGSTRARLTVDRALLVLYADLPRVLSRRSPGKLRHSNLNL